MELIKLALGLYIAKTTLINHGEDIKVSSEQGKYTEFVFTLPVAEKPATEKSDNPTGKKNK